MTATEVISLLGLGIFILISWGLIVWVVVFAASELVRAAGIVLPQVGLSLRARDESVSEWGLTVTYRLTHVDGASDEWVTVTPLSQSVRPELAVSWARTHSLGAAIRSLLWVGGAEDPDPCETGQPSKPVESRTRAQIQEDERRAKSGAALAVEPGQWIKAGERPHYMKPEKVLPPDTEPMKPEDLPVYPPRGATEPATQVIEPPSLSDPSHSIPRVESVATDAATAMSTSPMAAIQHPLCGPGRIPDAGLCGPDQGRPHRHEQGRDGFEC